MHVNVYEHKISHLHQIEVHQLLKHQTIQIHSSHLSANKQNSNS